ncbi:hypothetical protein BD779DRAFT_1506556 [Infundibulicybe gibba]|nr:hypothetical protein BD779DRAFT_1506556 [Infundibulicybe gibba]
MEHKPTAPRPLSLTNPQVTNGRPISGFFPALRVSTTILLVALLLVLAPCVGAQAPVNDVISWPPGLLLLATVLYAALGAAPDTLWDIEPAIGLFLGTGLPLVSLPTMQRVNWVARACHFVPGIRTAHGYSNFWIRTEDISQKGRSDVLQAVLGTLQPVVYERPELHNTPPPPWKVNELGLLEEIDTLPSKNPAPSNQPASADHLSARDFLLFSAVHYHAFWEWEVHIERKDEIIFSTQGTDARAVFSVNNPTDALPIVAAQLVRRPHSQSFIRQIACQVPGSEPPIFTLNLDRVSHTTPACAIDFHSYAKDTAKVSASLEELAGAYFRVVQYIKRSGHGWKASGSGPIAHAHVGQTIMDSGRFTIQDLPGRWGVRGMSDPRNYHPHANTASFGTLVESGGNSRRPAIPFLLAGFFGQAIICYFLSVGTSAGVWTSVALANSLFTGKLTDLHSIYYGKTAATQEPGMKMYMPGTKDIIAIATFDRTTPRQGSLRPGLMLNLLGLAAAIFGAIFQNQTRDALGFSTFRVHHHGCKEKTWFEDSQYPNRCAVYSTLPCSLLIAGLAVFFQLTDRARLWPILDAITWISGLPFGMLENGRMSGGDDNITHIILVNRWLMGAVASAIGSTISS